MGKLRLPSIALLASTSTFCLATIIVSPVLAQGPQQPTSGARRSEAAGQADHPLKTAIHIAEDSYRRVQKLEEYKAVFTKSEMVGGRNYASKMAIKFRQQPLSVYLRFINPEHAGREVLYVHGQNNNMMLAHDTGLRALAGTVPVDPHSRIALSHSRHPITQIGIANMTEALIKRWKQEAQFGDSEVKYYPKATLDGRPMLVIESSHRVPRKQVPYLMTRLWIDKETKFPVRIQNYDFPRRRDGKPILVEDYAYTDIQTDVDLTGRDFDAKNQAYNF